MEVWAKKYDRCIECKTKNRKHLAKGLCIYCYCKSKGYQKKWYEKSKHTLEYKINKKIAWDKYQNSKKYKIAIEKSNTKKVFKKFIQGKSRLKKYHGGVEVLINGQRIKTPIKPTGRENDNSPYKIDIFKEVFLKESSFLN